MTKYRCPHCGEVIEEVNVIEITKRKLLPAAGLGVGCGLLIYPLMPESKLIGAIGAFIVAFVVVFLVCKEQRLKTPTKESKKKE